MIEILTTGSLNSIQDLGRVGYLHIGVSRCGAMDTLAMEIGNALLGNSAGAAGIEVVIFPFRLRFHQTIAFAVTGADCAATLDEEPVPPYWSREGSSGQTLTLGPPKSGARAYITFTGGIDVPLVLGSRSTDQRSGFGGFNGRGLARGDRLALIGSHLPKIPFPSAGFGASFNGIKSFTAKSTVELRTLPATEFDAFTDRAKELFASNNWSITADSNRMGYRLRGPKLNLRNQMELFSHGIVPGTVQVPPSGQPIIQLADANTCGGYPKIATVVEADLWLLAQAPIGSNLRFVEVDGDAAVQAIRDQSATIQELRAVSALLARRA